MTRAGRLTLRPGPLRAAAGLAAIFIVARVVYRVLFNGASGAGTVLLPLPRVTLPHPIGWVSLFGPVTLDGLWDAVSSALPIAAVILAFGVLNALFDVSRLFVRLARRGPLRGIARALAVAWSTLPALGAAVRRVRTAQRLRGERPGPRMLIPVLERTLERAAAIANGLELRGFGGAPVESDCEHPVVVRDALLGFGDQSVLAVDDFSLRHGTLTMITGPTGAGKSTLLRSLAGLLDHIDGGWTAGRMLVAGLPRATTPPRDTSRLVGVVLQNPREGFCSESVRDEIGLALQLRGVASAIIDTRVDDVAARLGLTALLDRPVQALSAGEATMVAIAAAVVENPVLLLVDEPLADLDGAARSEVVAALDALAHQAGVCVVVAEHRWEAFGESADAWWRIDPAARELLADSAPIDARPGAPAASEPAASAPAEAATVGQHTTLASPEPVLTASGVRVVHRDVVAVRDAALTLSAGEIVALVGPNGAGKSSLLTALALPSKDIIVTGHPVLVPDASDDLFTRDTVAAECARADRMAKRSGIRSTIPAADRFAAFLGLDTASLAERMPRHPLDLSLGERRCLAIALQLTRGSEVLMIDEPTRGLDAIAREHVRFALRQAADAGTAVLLATHDRGFADSLGGRLLSMRDGVAPVPSTGSGTQTVENSGSQPAESSETWNESSGSRNGVDAPTPDRAPATPTPGPGPTPGPTPTRDETPRQTRSLPARHRPWLRLALIVANVLALASFTWPFVAAALPSQAEAAAPWAALAVIPIAALVTIAALDETVRSAHTLAYLAVLAAIGAAVRIASTGVGGIEAVLILLVLAGRAFGPRFGLLLGAVTIALSATAFGGFGPWTPFQMFACAWVGAGAGLLPRRIRGRAEIAMLCVYGALASYAFGLLMNVWFWPFAIGSGATISYVPGAPVGQNLGSFLLYSLVTSTASWDTLRAVTTIIGIVLIGRPVLAALRRAKPLQPAAPRSAASAHLTPRSTSPRGGGTRTRRSTAPGATAVRR